MWQTISYYATLFIEAALGVFGLRLYEEPRYQVIERIGDRIEIRDYSSRIAAQATVATTGSSGRSEAFQLLFNYIAGANTAAGLGSARVAMTTPVQVGARRIAMTTPVQATDSTGPVQMQFFLPAKYTSENAPAPSDPRVEIVTVPSETIAALRFSGSGRDFSEQQSALLAALGASQWRPSGAPFSLTYDAPFTIPFLRRNEAGVTVQRDAIK